MQLLETYLEQEISLPVEERIQNPSLGEVETVYFNLKNSRTARTNGKTQRIVNIETRNTTVKRLLDLLQLAAALRVNLHHGGTLSQQLENWGYEVM